MLKKSESAPVIGVTASLKVDADPIGHRPGDAFARTDMDYVQSVAMAGGIPLILPPITDEAVIESMALKIDGLLLGGGSDLDPACYGEEPVAEMGAIVPERDTFELALFERALDLNLPVFGICRGHQLINVALGGTLYQDLNSQLDGELLKHRQAAPKWHPTHFVEVEEASELSSLTDSGRVHVNTYHHQAIKDLAGGLEVSARASDGVVEAIETEDMSRRWMLGVQWHAEAMSKESRENLALFEAHVSAARRYTRQRRAAA